MRSARGVFAVALALALALAVPVAALLSSEDRSGASASASDMSLDELAARRGFHLIRMTPIAPLSADVQQAAAGAELLQAQGRAAGPPHPPARGHAASGKLARSKRLRALASSRSGQTAKAEAHAGVSRAEAMRATAAAEARFASQLRTDKSFAKHVRSALAAAQIVGVRFEMSAAEAAAAGLLTRSKTGASAGAGAMGWPKWFRLNHDRAFSAKGTDARRTYVQKQRDGLMNTLMNACGGKDSPKAEQLQIQWQVGGTAHTMGASSSDANSAGWTGMASTVLPSMGKPDVSGALAVTCGSMPKCGQCLYQGLMNFINPWSIADEQGSDSFGALTTCDVRLIGWCSGLMREWLCQMAHHNDRGTGHTSAAANTDLSSNSAYCAALGTSERGKCSAFEQWLRPLRPDMMRELRCDLAGGQGKLSRTAYAMLHSLMATGKTLSTPLLQLIPYFGKRLNPFNLVQAVWDRRSSSIAEAASFSCPASAYDRVDDVCVTFLDRLQLPALGTTQPDQSSQALCPADLFACFKRQLAYARGVYQIDNPDTFAKFSVSTPGVGIGAAPVVTPAVEFGVGRANAVAVAAAAPAGAVAQTPEGKIATELLDGMSATDDARKCDAVDTMWKSLTNPQRLSFVKSRCSGGDKRAAEYQCHNDLLICGALTKAAAVRLQWKQTEPDSDRLPAKLHDVCNNLSGASKALALRCTKWLDANKVHLPALMEAMGCTPKQLDVTKVDFESTAIEDQILTCRSPEETAAHDSVIANRAVQKCLSLRNTLGLTSLAQCEDAMFATGGAVPALVLPYEWQAFPPARILYRAMKWQERKDEVQRVDAAFAAAQAAHGLAVAQQQQQHQQAVAQQQQQHQLAVAAAAAHRQPVPAAPAPLPVPAPPPAPVRGVENVAAPVFADPIPGQQDLVAMARIDTAAVQAAAAAAGAAPAPPFDSTAHLMAPTQLQSYLADLTCVDVVGARPALGTADAALSAEACPSKETMKRTFLYALLSDPQATTHRQAFAATGVSAAAVAVLGATSTAQQRCVYIASRALFDDTDDICDESAKNVPDAEALIRACKTTKHALKAATDVLAPAAYSESSSLRSAIARLAILARPFAAGSFAVPAYEKLPAWVCGYAAQVPAVNNADLRNAAAAIPVPAAAAAQRWAEAGSECAVCVSTFTTLRAGGARTSAETWSSRHAPRAGVAKPWFIENRIREVVLDWSGVRDLSFSRNTLANAYAAFRTRYEAADQAGLTALWTRVYGTAGTYTHWRPPEGVAFRDGVIAGGHPLYAGGWKLYMQNGDGHGQITAKAAALKGAPVSVEVMHKHFCSIIFPSCAV